MTEHKTEELKRQRDAAKSRHTQSGMELALAEKRLHDAMCRDTGMMGKTVVGSKGVKVLVHDIDFVGNSPWCLKGFAYKADGTVGYSERRVYIKDVVPQVTA